jgi:hypothetical protein
MSSVRTQRVRQKTVKRTPNSDQSYISTAVVEAARDSLVIGPDDSEYAK